MKLEMEFQGSEISEIKIGKNEIEIHFSHVVIISSPASSGACKTQGVSATIFIGSPRYKKLPKEGKLSDGELYGIPGKPLNGRIAVDFQSCRECELELSVEHDDFSISGKSFKVNVDMKTLPDELRH